MISETMLEKLATPKPGRMTTRLPTRFAKTNAALIASVKAEEQSKLDRARLSIERLQGGGE